MPPYQHGLKSERLKGYFVQSLPWRIKAIPKANGCSTNYWQAVPIKLSDRFIDKFAFFLLKTFYVTNVTICKCSVSQRLKQCF